MSRVKLTPFRLVSRINSTVKHSTFRLWAEEAAPSPLQYDIRGLVKKILTWDAEKAKELLWEKFKENTKGTAITQLALLVFHLKHSTFCNTF